MVSNSNHKNVAKIAAAASVLCLPVLPSYELNDVQDGSLVMENVRDGLKSNYSFQQLKKTGQKALKWFTAIPARCFSKKLGVDNKSNTNETLNKTSFKEKYITPCIQKLAEAFYLTSDESMLDKAHLAFMALAFKLTMPKNFFAESFKLINNGMQHPIEFSKHLQKHPRAWNENAVLMLAVESKSLNSMTDRSLRNLFSFTMKYGQARDIRLLLNAIKTPLKYPFNYNGSAYNSLLLLVMDEIRETQRVNGTVPDRLRDILKAVLNKVGVEDDIKDVAINYARDYFFKDVENSQKEKLMKPIIDKYEKGSYYV